MRIVMSIQDHTKPISLHSQEFFRIAELATTAERPARTFTDCYGRVRRLKGKPAKKGLLPLGESTIWEMVRKGEFPKPIKLSDRITVWKSSDILQWMKSRNLV